MNEKITEIIKQMRMEFSEKDRIAIANNYTSYESMDDIVINGKSGFVISNDAENKKLIVEYIDSGEMETIDYSKPIEAPKSEPKVSDTRFYSLQEAMNEPILFGLISNGELTRRATDKEMKEISLTENWSAAANKYDGWSVFFLNSGQSFVFRTQQEAKTYIKQKQLLDISDQYLSYGGSIKSKWFNGELSFLNW